MLSISAEERYVFPCVIRDYGNINADAVNVGDDDLLLHEEEGDVNTSAGRTSRQMETAAAESSPSLQHGARASRGQGSAGTSIRSTRGDALSIAC